jgi:hypothetical protein
MHPLIYATLYLGDCNGFSVISAGSLMIRLIHHLPAPVIHRLLLQLQLPEFFPNGKTVEYGTIVSLALPGVYL